MKYSQAAVVAIVAGASAVSAVPTGKASKLGHRLGKGLEMAGTFAQTAQYGSLGTRNLSQDPASVDPATQAPLSTTPNTHHTATEQVKGKSHHRSATETGKRKHRKHKKVTEPTTPVAKAEGTSSTSSTPATPEAPSTNPATQPATPASTKVTRDLEDELEARFPHFGRVGMAGARMNSQMASRSVEDELVARFPGSHRLGASFGHSHSHSPSQEARSFDELEARLFGLSKVLGKFRKHGSSAAGAASSVPSDQPSGRSFDEESLSAREVDELEARLFGLSKVLGKFRKHGGSAAGAATSTPSDQPSGRSFDEDSLFERDFDELEARFLGLGKLFGKMRKGGSAASSVPPPSDQVSARSFDEDSLFERDFDDLEARFLGLGKLFGKMRKGGSAASSVAPPSDQPSGRSFDEESLYGRDFDELEARFPGMGKVKGMFGRFRHHGGASSAPPPSDQPSGRSFDEESLYERDFDELEARFPGMGKVKGMFGRFRHHGGASSAPPPSDQPSSRSFDEEPLYERDFDELEARFPGMGKVKGMFGRFRHHGGASSAPPPSDQPSSRSFDEESLYERDFDELEARFPGMGKVKGMFGHFRHHGGASSAPPPSDQPSGRSFNEDELVLRGFADALINDLD